MQQRNTYIAVALTALLLTGFLATSVASYWITGDVFRERTAEDSRPLSRDNI